jgi:hypothetical protein
LVLVEFVHAAGPVGAVPAQAIVHCCHVLHVLHASFGVLVAARFVGCGNRFGTHDPFGFVPEDPGFAPEFAGGRPEASAAHEAVNDDAFGFGSEVLPVRCEARGGVRSARSSR